MKYGFCLLFCLPLIISAQESGKPFKLNGTLKDLKFQPEMVYLQYQANGEWKTDSTVVNENKYTFSGQLNEPSQARLRVKYKVWKTRNDTLLGWVNGSLKKEDGSRPLIRRNFYKICDFGIIKPTFREVFLKEFLNII